MARWVVTGGGTSASSPSGSRRRIASALLAAATALSVSTGVMAPAHATFGGGGHHPKPTPTPTTTSGADGTVTIRKGAERRADRSVAGLAGATFELYAVSSASELTGGTRVGTCTTGAAGTCDVPVKIASSGSYFYARETSAPAGWGVIDAWGDASRPMAYNTGRMTPSSARATLPSTTRSWPNVRTNPVAPDRCGLDLKLVMDVSGSIDDRELAKFRTAAKGVVSALANTPSRIAVSRFDTTASDVLGLTSVATQSGVATLNAAIDRVDGDNLTNWDEALAESVDSDYDVVILVTDGDPTTYVGDRSATGNTRLVDLEEAIHSANAVKAAGSQVVAVGVDITATASKKRLTLVSSPQDTYTSSWSDLAAKLKDIATAACTGKVTVQKVVQDASGKVVPNSTDANGWQFAGQASAGQLGAFAPTATVNGATGFTVAEYTAPRGTTATMTLAETQKPGYSFVGASCKVDDRDVTVTVTDAAKGRFSFPATAQSAISCVVTNRVALADLAVSTTASTAYRGAWSWTVAKDVDRSYAEVPAGGRATFNYTVVATPKLARTEGYTVRGNLTVTNPNAVAVSGVSVAERLPGATCTIDGQATGLTVPARGSLTRSYTCADPAGTPTAKGTVTAEATWNAGGHNTPTGRATATAAYDYAAAEATWTGRHVRLVDSRIDVDGQGENGVLLDAQDGPATYTYVLGFDAPAGRCATYENVASVGPVEGGTPLASDSASVEVCAEAAPSVALSAEGGLEAAYGWSITKVVDATRKEVDPATGQAVFSYTVEVKAGERTVSGQALTGTVKVTNPNTYANGAIDADVALASTFGAGVTCTVTGAATVLAPGASADLPFTCAFSGTAPESGTVTATLTYDPAGEATSATVTASEPVTLAVRAERDRTVDVVDDQTRPGTRVVLAEDLPWSAGLVRTFTYDLALAGGPSGECAAYTNTAVVDTSGTDPSASVTVQSCSPPPEVKPVQQFGKAKGAMRASCQGTVTATLRNESGEAVKYVLKVGDRTKKVTVRAQKNKRVQVKGSARDRAVLKANRKVLDRIRVPKACKPPTTLPPTGVDPRAWRASGLDRTTAARLAAVMGGWFS